MVLCRCGVFMSVCMHNVGRLFIYLIVDFRPTESPRLFFFLVFDILTSVCCFVGVPTSCRRTKQEAHTTSKLLLLCVLKLKSTGGPTESTVERSSTGSTGGFTGGFIGGATGATGATGSSATGSDGFESMTVNSFVCSIVGNASAAEDVKSSFTALAAKVNNPTKSQLISFGTGNSYRATVLTTGAVMLVAKAAWTVKRVRRANMKDEQFSSKKSRSE